MYKIVLSLFLGFSPLRERPKPRAGCCLLFEYGFDDPWRGHWTLPLGPEILFRFSYLTPWHQFNKYRFSPFPSLGRKKNI